ncbi:acyl-CoA transferase/carnitine dehydratase protein (plasmid) [Rhizobium gallicum]|uniref:Acyl-CoA transferase/carnitine dehydratase protein n=1 Tax=Rhizobium gallicum TaxID=56730 RepID=A0A1L5NPI5_9HYPH|nr:CaiB/BaiF CoA-transferase family protein [Rhizobium gallicum]APO69803.1 acyl-CoA transferase/carnitine dehydratase protein [Rhizobium gallicum]
MSQSPLHGIKILDLSQHAPGPFATMILGDLGAEVIHVSHPSAGGGPGYFAQVLDDPFMGIRFSSNDTLMRNKRSIFLDLKTENGREICRKLALEADAIVVEMRPGKLAKFGLDHATLSVDNPGLITCCISGYGGSGPHAQTPGHDLNYIALSGALEVMRDSRGEPLQPQNVLADYAGGGYLAVIGILAALAARAKSGQGQEIDVGMLDGALLTLADLFSAPLNGIGDVSKWRTTLGGGMPNYRCYLCADGRYIAVGALEKRFFETLLSELNLLHLMDKMEDGTSNLMVTEELAAKFAEQPQSYWLKLLEGKEVCVTPVLDMAEVGNEPQVLAREMVIERFGVRQIAPAPRFSKTPSSVRTPPPKLGSHTTQVLRELGYDDESIDRIFESGAVGAS